jgi:hypothetical protein
MNISFFLNNQQSSASPNDALRSWGNSKQSKGSMRSWRHPTNRCVKAVKLNNLPSSNYLPDDIGLRPNVVDTNILKLKGVPSSKAIHILASLLANVGFCCEKKVSMKTIDQHSILIIDSEASVWGQCRRIRSDLSRKSVERSPNELN